ncbi:MAG: antitoxin VapB family protein [Candidatus Freyarchaeota archaeon]|nr:antitoxin VapB family protein [Candidatus Jordarchaeia archaeon]MBS7270037.1 antitoxin VapB family protein [Candidatus Jordarchaeia archaeon]MBS7280497.1 antitoxin VapB family protein [Candidatus Jordarchaeia archaeon]
MTKTISLSDEAYKLLKSIKRDGESFSDVIKRLVGKKGKLIDVLELYPELSDAREYEEEVGALRKEIDKRLENEMY